MGDDTAEIAPLHDNEAPTTTSSPVKLQPDDATRQKSASVVHEHELSDANEEFELKFDFTGKLKNYASVRWKGWLKWVIIIGGIFLAVMIVCIIGHEVGRGMRRNDFSHTPGLELISESDFIRFHYGRPRSYHAYTEYLKSYLQDFSAMKGRSLRNCTGMHVSTPRHACRFDVAKELGSACTFGANEFGYHAGKPCVLLKVKRVKDWVPDPFTPLDSIPPAIVGVWRPDHVLVTCKGEYQQDKEFIGPITYYPHAGVHTKYFPYTGQKTFQDPLIFIQFERPAREMTIFVRCELWSRHVTDDVRDKMAVRFTLMVE